MVELSFIKMIYENVISIWQTVTGNNVASPPKIDLCYTTGIFGELKNPLPCADFIFYFQFI